MSALAVVALSAAAMAGPAQLLSGEFSADAPAPAFGMACSPLRDTVQLAMALGSLAEGTGNAELDRLLEAARDPEVQTVDGLDVQGAFAMVGGPGFTTTILPVSGSVEEALSLFLREADDRGAWTVDGHTASMIAEDGSKSVLSLQGAQARLTRWTDGAATAPSGRGAPAALTTLPDGSGCAVWIEPTNGDGSAPPILRNPVAVWMPFAPGEPLQLQVQLPPHRDRTAVPELVPPVEVHGSSRPRAVLTLGVPVLAILQDPVVQESLPPMVRAGLPSGGFFEDLGAGLTVGTFLGPAGPSVVGVVPLRSSSGRPVPARRIWRITSEAVLEAQKGRRAPVPQRIGRRALQVQVTPGVALTMVATRGRLVVGNQRGEVEAVARDEGVPWLDAEQQAWAGTHALALFGEAPLAGLGTPLEVTVGAGTRGDVLAVWIQLEPGLSDPRVAAALRALGEARRKSGKSLLPGTGG